MQSYCVPSVDSMMHIIWKKHTQTLSGLPGGFLPGQETEDRRGIQPADERRFAGLMIHRKAYFVKRTEKTDDKGKGADNGICLTGKMGGDIMIL